MYNKSKKSLFLFQLYINLLFIAFTFGQDDQSNVKCDQTKCPGPLAYYNALKCKPIYGKTETCCATKYDCSHLDERSKNKCYINGKEYSIGEELKDEDKNPCDIGCICLKGYDGIATFNCAIVDCFHGPTKPGCFRKKSPLKCCSGEEVCPEKPEDRATCNVDGKEYKDGEYFEVKGEPDLTCTCQPGYEGKNVEPFCAKPKRNYCSPEKSHSSYIFNKCAPVYYSSQSPQTSCSVVSRCQNNNDTLIHNSTNDDNSTEDISDKCIFGNISMKIGDELNQATDYSSVCVRCVCEIPPLPTCQRLPDNECDVTNYMPFLRYGDERIRNSNKF